MESAPSTPAALRSALRDVAPGAEVVFSTEDGPVGAGYHVTELKHLKVRSIDCGGRLAATEEAAFQILDVPGRRAMAAGKLLGILDKSFASLPGLALLPLHAEFGHGNDGLSRYEVTGLEAGEAGLRVLLGRSRARCRPFEDARGAGARTGCCG